MCVALNKNQFPQNPALITAKTKVNFSHKHLPNGLRSDTNPGTGIALLLGPIPIALLVMWDVGTAVRRIAQWLTAGMENLWSATPAAMKATNQNSVPMYRTQARMSELSLPVMPLVMLAPLLMLLTFQPPLMICQDYIIASWLQASIFMGFCPNWMTSPWFWTNLF